MRRLIEPKDRKLSSFFCWLHLFVFRNKCSPKVFGGCTCNRIGERHRIRSLKPPRFIHNLIRYGFNNSNGFFKNGFNSDSRIVFSDNVDSVIVNLKQLDNAHKKISGAIFGLLNQIEDFNCTRFGVKEGNRCASIKKIMHGYCRRILSKWASSLALSARFLAKYASIVSSPLSIPHKEARDGTFFSRIRFSGIMESSTFALPTGNSGGKSRVILRLAGTSIVCSITMT